MSETTDYPVEPAQQLLTRLMHRFKPNLGRVEASARALLNAFSELGRDKYPLATSFEDCPNGLRLLVQVAQRAGEPARVTVGFDKEKQQFSLAKGREIEDVPLEYEPVLGRFVATRTTQDGREVTPVEVLLQMVWDLASKPPPSEDAPFAVGLKRRM